MSIQCPHPVSNYHFLTGYQAIDRFERCRKFAHFEGFAQTLAIPLFFIVTQTENFITLHYESRFACCVPNLKASNEFPV